MKFRFFLSILLALLFVQSLAAQTTELPYGKYWVELTDKAENTYSLSRPQEFLSARSIKRRMREQVSIKLEDLPVSEIYIKAIQATGVQLHGASKWLNAVAITADSNQLAPLYQLSFVRKITYIGRNGLVRNLANPTLPARPGVDSLPKPNWGNPIDGYASIQNQILGVSALHRLGFRGEGILVAVMDGGFRFTDQVSFFDSLAADHRLIQGHDFVEGDDYVLEDATHGTSVLSVMASNLPGYFMGTAPDATYVLLKTEDIGSEYPIEEVNWVLGAEYADSIGADIVNASLGYTHFTDTSLNHNYANLDGKTTIGSRGARIAAQKGMIICNSAGNSGNDPWHYIGVPSDAPGLLAVGAVDYDLKRASFSSFGPTADGRIKPDLSAPGESIVTAGNSGVDLGMSNGTSLASPLLAGALAALWSSDPSRPSSELLAAVFATANQAEKPTVALGWGVPDMTESLLELEGLTHRIDPYFNGIATFDATLQTASLFLPKTISDPKSLQIMDIFGKKVNTARASVQSKDFSLVHISGINSIPKGFYIGKIQAANGEIILFPLVK